ncbi:FKBP-type peptidyl-prolyl cis-trans isomerase [Apibacter adventoris]|uniref:Peptidyl-prolyl cis-trans isomerase n=1 Tax=Apibacter adventoris TaxID=1679466 RepID=A0A2S8A994_9FLAO|nr:FKBP-type peptidyl-prolyl cis-trans isomerase [Apibacter adventoris]PQL91149.1 peptidylprolyl isomerase [Apibacter adventoris]PQL94078.1 peptidylprolyl isomerase [Apibacter adventoris]
MIKKTILVLFTGILLVSCNKEKKVTTLKTDDEKASYAIGLSLAQSFKPQGLDKDINLDIVKQAMQDKFENKKLLFPEDSIQSFMTAYIPKHLEKTAKRNTEESKKFLDENKKKSGIKVTNSGLQYKVEKEGTGAKPTDDDLVSVNYVLKTIDGTVIEDSKKATGNKPADIPLSRVVPGWKEGVKLMSKGAKYILYVPSDLAYGENGPAGPNQALIFEIELVDFKPMPKQEAQQENGEKITPEQMEQLKQQMQKAQQGPK